MKFRFSIIFGLSLSWLLISNANAACNYKLDSLYFPFPDSLKLKSLFVYRVNTENMAPEFSEYDTTLFGAQNVFALTRYSVGSFGTGNNGGAIEAIDYFLRPEDVSFLFIRNFIPYMNTPTNIPIINSTKRFTRLGYSTNKKAIGEQTLDVTHNQNIVPGWSVGLKFNAFSTAGFFQNQNTRNNSVILYSSFYGPRLKSYVTFAFQRMRVVENGGVLAESYIKDTIMDSENVPVNLNDAKNEIRGMQIFASNSYGIVQGAQKGKAGEPYLELRHTLKYDRFSRVFYDDPTTHTNDVQYFDNYFISKTTTNDSSYYRNLTNELTLSGNFLSGLNRAMKLYVKSGIELERYYYWKPTFFLNKLSDIDYTNLYTGAGLFTRYKGIDLSIYAKSYVSGRRSGDVLFDGRGNFFFTLLGFPVRQSANLSISTITPDFFTTQYFSNNFQWNNNFNKINELRASYSLALPKLRSTAEVRFETIGNYVYFDTTATPVQNSGQVSVASLFVSNHLRVGILHLVHQGVLQSSTDEMAIPLPKLAFKASYYVQFSLVKNVLSTQIGGDIFYYTKFYADAYQPATAQFYRQRIRKLGAYPLISGFINFQWKRAQIFLKYDHLDQNWFGRDYFSAHSYPIGDFSFKFGVYWNFYD